VEISAIGQDGSNDVGHYRSIYTFRRVGANQVTIVSTTEIVKHETDNAWTGIQTSIQGGAVTFLVTGGAAGTVSWRVSIKVIDWS
jgi:hypothetical protein